MKRTIYAIASLAFCAPLMAYAAEGFVGADISLQSGPDTEYPSITELSAGTPVEVEGCIDGYTWCDVIVGDDRGWVPGSFLEEDYNNQPVVLIDYGPRIGIPVVSFDIGVYWDHYYHGRPFYAQREQWVSRHITPRSPPRPAHLVATKPGEPHGRVTQNKTQPVTNTHPATTAVDRSRTEQERTERKTTAAQTGAKVEPQPKPVVQRAQQPEAAPQLKPSPKPAVTPTAKPVTEARQVTEPKNEAKPKDELKPAPRKEDEHKDDKGGGR